MAKNIVPSTNSLRLADDGSTQMGTSSDYNEKMTINLFICYVSNMAKKCKKRK